MKRGVAQLHWGHTVVSTRTVSLTIMLNPVAGGTRMHGPPVGQMGRKSRWLEAFHPSARPQLHLLVTIHIRGS
jgi:hypothetical protein